VVGGLYGNEPALQTVLALFAQEPGQKRMVFNGDFHWFDTDPDRFARITEAVLSHDAMRGNVETEISQLTSQITDDAGCGCAYPDWVGDEVVDRSNHILQRLRATAQTRPDLQQRLAALPMWLRVDVGGTRLAVVHGDAESLAGWGFAQEHLQDPTHQRTVRAWFDAAQVQAFACSHTCLPVFQSFAAPATPGSAHDPLASPRWVFNNGAAGMPNFRGETAGLLTRIATSPYSGPARSFGVHQAALHVDAIAIEFDKLQWQQQFLQQWPAGSDAHLSYWDRIQAGPNFDAAGVVRAERAPSV
jgi:hypothetical protein